MKFKVENLTNARGNKVSNQFIIRGNNTTLFQSYKTLIAKIDSNQNIILDTNALDYSVTTSKHLYQFLREEINMEFNRKTILKLIEIKVIKLRDLNK